MWKVLVGDVEIGQLNDPHTVDGTIRCAFQPSGAFARYSPAFATGDIWEADDDALDSIIDELAVEGVFLVAGDGTQIVDPDLRIDGTDAWFPDQSSSST